MLNFINKVTKSTKYALAAMLMLAVQIMPLSVFMVETASAADSAVLFPNGQGTYTDWENGESTIDETGTPVCTSGDYIRAGEGGNDNDDNNGDRESVLIDLSSIPNGSTIESVLVQVTHRAEDDDETGGTFQTFARLNGANTDSGANITANSDEGCNSASQSINVSDIAKSGATTLEVGVRKTGTSGNADNRVRVGTIRATVSYTPPVQTNTNPTLTQACGLDIALVLDNSQSITSDQRTQMKNALKQFTSALNGTPTQFSVTRFGNSADVMQAFTNSVATVDAAIDNFPASPSGEYTNWQAGINAAQGTFAGGTSNPNLMIFATDGDPTASTAGSNGPVDETGYTLHLPPAVTSANNAKSVGTRMLALGIGNPTVSRLEAISGPNDNTGSVLTSDVITTDFDSLAQQLATFATQTCGGTITTTKLIDDDNNPQTPAVFGENWNFNVAGSPEITDEYGKTPAVNVGAGTHTVTETVKPGYRIVTASCKDSTGDNRGDYNSLTNSVEGINITANDIISCEFINEPTAGKIIIEKIVVGGPSEGHPEHFKFNRNGAQSTFENDGTNEHSFDLSGFPNGSSQTVTEIEIPAGYTPTYSNSQNQNQNCDSLLVTVGSTVTCTITNTYSPPPKLTLEKVVVNNNGGKAKASDWKLMAVDGQGQVVIDQSGPVTSTEEVVAGNAYELSEYGGPGGYSASDWSCDGGNLDGNEITLSRGENVKCTITNDDIKPNLTVTKQVHNKWGGNLSVNDFPLYVNLSPVQSGVAQYLNAGWYVIGEIQQPGYELVDVVGDCKLVLGLVIAVELKVGSDSNYNCTLVNKDKPGSITLYKKVINDNGGKKEAKDFKLNINFKGDVEHGKAHYLPAGYHRIWEQQKPGYKLTDIKCYDGFKQVDPFYTFNDGSIKVNLKLDQHLKCWLVNDDIAPKVTVKKIAFPHYTNEEFDFVIDNQSQPHWAWWEDRYFDLKHGQGYTTDDNFKAGNIEINEFTPGNWTLTDIDCYVKNHWGFWQPMQGNGDFKAELGKEYKCIFTNDKKGDTSGHKFNDLNGDGVWDEGEPVMEGWTIELYKKVCGPSLPEIDQQETRDFLNIQNYNYQAPNFECDYEPYAPMPTTDTNPDGSYSFGNLEFGWYKVCENQEQLSQGNGWKQTTPEDCHKVNVSRENRSNRGLNFGNAEHSIEVVANPVCINNFPYLNWTVLPHNFTPTQFTLEWYTVDGNGAGDPAGVLADTQHFTVADTTYDAVSNTYSATTLWPGTSLTLPDWPGWSFENGLWVEDPNDVGGNLLPSANVEFDVNPTVAAPATYPPSTEACVPTNPQVLGESTLANTGSSTLIASILALSLIGTAGSVALLQRKSK